MQAPNGYAIRFPKEGGPPGEHGSVAFDDKLWRMFCNAPDKGRAQIEAVMRMWCRAGPANIPSQKFKFQEHYQKAGKSVRIEEFKGWQVRFYGTTVEVDGKPMFLVTGADLSKKRTKADPDILKAAGKAAYDLKF
jgi:hypothetical protein